MDVKFHSSTGQLYHGLGVDVSFTSPLKVDHLVVESSDDVLFGIKRGRFWESTEFQSFN